MKKVFRKGDRYVNLYVEEDRNYGLKSFAYIGKRNFLFRIFYKIFKVKNPTTKIYHQIFSYLQDLAKEKGQIRYAFTTNNDKMIKWFQHKGSEMIEWNQVNVHAGIYAIKYF